MKIALGIILSLTLVSCATPGKRKGPSPYSASWSGETVTPVSQKHCPPNQAYKKQSWKSLVHQAASCVRANNFFQVERIANHLAKVEPESHWGAYFLSLAAESRNDIPRAFWMIELALKKAPEDGILLFQRARLHWASKNHILAVKDLEEAVDRNPTIVEAHLLLAQVQFTTDELGDAEASFKQVLAQDPKRPEALFGLGEIAFKTQRYDEAYAYHKKAANYDSRLAVSFMRMAQIQEIHFKDYSASLEAYKDLQRRVGLNRVDGTLPIDVSEKVKNLSLLVQQSVAQASDKKLSKREPSGKKVSK